MKIAQLPDGTQLEFPDDTADAIIDGTVKHHLATQNVSTAEDAGKAALYAIPKAITGLAGLPGDMRDLAKMGKEKILSVLPDWVRSADSAVPNPLDFVARGFPTSGQLRSKAEDITGPWYDPLTLTGKVVDTGVQTAATMGRNWLTAPRNAALITGAITGGTEGAGALTNDNPWARLAGGVAAGGIPAGLAAMRDRPGVLVKEAFGNATPSEIAAAKAMEQQGANLGIPLMGTESLDRGHQLASAVLAHPSGNTALEAFLKQRSAQAGNAVQRDLIGQTGPLASPGANAGRAQAAATDVIGNAEQSRTNAVKPFYDAARQDVIGPDTMAALQQVIENQRRFFPGDQSVFNRYAGQIAPAESGNAAVLDNIYRAARIEKELPSIGATPEQKQAAAALKNIVPEFASATQMSPNLAAGRKLYSDITAKQIDPLTAGPVGVVAGRVGFDPAAPSAVPRVTSAIADANQARPATIKELYTNLNAVDRQAFPGMVQTHLENQLNTALGDIRSGANPTAGAKFRQAIAGTPQERANFDEMMRGVAVARGNNPADVVKGANVLLDVLERTGRTPGIGSQTAGRSEIAKEMGKTLITDSLGMISLTPAKPLARRISDYISRGRYSEIAKALTAPDSVAQLAKMAKLDPNGTTASFYAASLLGLDRAIANGQ